MKRKNYYILLLVVALFQFGNYSYAAHDSQNFDYNFTGKLNHKLNVIFNLKHTNGKLSGFYYYDKIGIDIILIGEVVNDHVVLYELDFQHKKQAKITGQFSAQGFKGNWQNIITKKVLPIDLKRSNKTIPLLPNNLAGTYAVSEEQKCRLSISIKPNKGEYFYNFKSAKRNLSGKITFGRSLEENLIYINFIGIEWAEYNGDVTKADDDSLKDNDLPTVIQGLLSKSEIAIQNTGNAMNSYVKIAECDEKYILLKKK